MIFLKKIEAWNVHSGLGRGKGGTYTQVLGLKGHKIAKNLKKSSLYEGLSEFVYRL